MKRVPGGGERAPFRMVQKGVEKHNLMTDEVLMR